MKHGYLIDAAPHGLCAECREALAHGTTGALIPLSVNANALAAYCTHREVGAYILLAPGLPRRWNLVSPIDAVDFKAMCDSLREQLVGLAFLAGLMDGPTPPAAGDVTNSDSGANKPH